MQFIAYTKLMRIDKPIGSLLLLWPTLTALWIASQGQPPVELVIIFILGTFIMRSAGCVINDFADRNFDGEVESCLLYTSPSPRDGLLSRMPSSA